MSSREIRAIIWDYDGTLVDTRLKNLNVTRKIIANLTGTDANAYPVLQSLENYSIANRKTFNWRELYRDEFGLNEAQIDAAGLMWTPYQLEDQTEVSLYPGITEVLDRLAAFPQGIVSQNSKSNIARNLEKNDILGYFDCIVGYEEVDIKRQKPAPDGLLSCIAALSVPEPGNICYIGDHETDVQSASAANHTLRRINTDVRIHSIGACYDFGLDISSWSDHPDFVAWSVEEIVEIVERIRQG